MYEHGENRRKRKKGMNEKEKKISHSTEQK